MTEIHRDRPADNEIEVSLFGPGYGESVVVHLGSNRWMVVDSCLDKNSGRAASLAYLEEIGVEPASHVELVVCTHWHDDHIRGMSSILSACPNARFVCSTSLRESAFLELVALGETIRGPHGGGLNEFGRIFQQIILRRQRQEPSPLETCHAGTVLVDQVEESAQLRIESLSPSDTDHQRMMRAFAEKKDQLLSAEFKQTVPSIHPNLGSIVLRLQIGGQRILLGADMEKRKSPESGWNAILINTRPGSEADLYKIAHHGSETGDMPEIWSQLLIPNCPAVLAPNQRLSNPIPRPSDVERILSHTKSAFATAPSYLKRKRLEQPTDRLLRNREITIYEIPSSQGQIRARFSPGSDDVWSIATFGRAFKLVQEN
jgi:beta-lactamase superfamily II metal-dependent hydrolase